MTFSFSAPGDPNTWGEEPDTFIMARGMTADQQIRAKALECAVKICSEAKEIPKWQEMRDLCVELETYIREGK